MTNLAIGTLVQTPNGEIGWVRSEPALTPVGEVVHVEFIPAFAHTTPSGWSDYKVEELAEATVCGCATLGYRDRETGELVHTGCDVDRLPGKGRTFLPGHDAKAKGFLIRAWGNGGKFLGGHDHALAASYQFGDKITAKVAAGIENERQRSTRVARNRLLRVTVKGESQATRAVMRNLQKSDGHEPVGYSFGGRHTDLESFIRNAKAWLGDCTELRSSTIENADYTVVYEHFVTNAN